MRGGIAASDTPPDQFLEQVLAHPAMEGLDLACGVSTDEPYVVPATGREEYHVAAFDFGVKASSPRLLSERGCRVTVLPAEANTADVLELDPDGLFLSNGPGDPAAVERAAETILEVAGMGIPVFGICLGHQLIARAFGAETFKLPFGHHGGNHPVMNHDRGTVEITSQNHGFAVRGGERDEVPGAPCAQSYSQQPVRRDGGGDLPRHAPGDRRPVPSGGGARAPRQQLPLRRLRGHDGCDRPSFMNPNPLAHLTMRYEPGCLPPGTRRRLQDRRCRTEPLRAACLCAAARLPRRRQ